MVCTPEAEVKVCSLQIPRLAGFSTVLR